MKNAASTEKLSSTGTDIANRVKNLFSGSPSNRRRRAASVDVLSTQMAATHPPSNPVLGVPLKELLVRDGLNIPFIVKKIVEHVEEHGLDQVGLYRINGNVKSIEKLRIAFDKVGDANFEEEDIATVAGLLKLFLRELPDSVIPEILVPHFVSVQQSYTGQSGSPEALDALHLCLTYLPASNYGVLKYLIRHLTRVTDFTQHNKMTAVSLSIVFGPNLLHCGEGLEGLRMQGYSNSIVCQMIQHYRQLFGKKKPPTQLKDGGAPPTKPLPYADHMASKQQQQQQQQTVLSGDSGDVSQELEVTRSERSIDEAILERSSTSILSPTSPAHLPLDDVKSTPQVSAHPASTGEPTIIVNHANADGDDYEEGAGFQRRNAKRGMSFKPREDALPNTILRSISSGPVLKCEVKGAFQSRQLATLNLKGEDERSLRTPSPHQSSPGTSPPTSPVLTPRASSVVNSVVGASVRDYLFRASQLSETPLQSGGAKQNVYGLLLPDRSSSLTSNTPSIPTWNSKSASLTSKASPTSTSTSTSTTTSQRSNGRPEDQDAHDAATDGATDVAGMMVVVKRRTKNPRGQRNRKSALHGEDHFTLPDSPPISTSTAGMATDPLSNTQIQILSVSPEHKSSSFLATASTAAGGQGERAGGSEGGVVDSLEPIQSQRGRVLDLVKQFDEAEDVLAAERSSSRGAGSPLKEHRLEQQDTAGDEDVVRRGSAVAGNDEQQEEGVGRGKLDMKAFDIFEKSGTIMGLGVASGSVVPRTKVSFCPTVSTLTEPRASQAGQHSLALSSTASDEEVFGSPVHGGSNVTEGRGKLSTTASDDVFLHDHPRGSDDFDGVPPTATLNHLTLSRPKGPASRRMPRHYSAPEASTAPSAAAPPTTTSSSTSSSPSRRDKKRRSHDIQALLSKPVEPAQDLVHILDSQMMELAIKQGLTYESDSQIPAASYSTNQTNASSASHRIAPNPPLARNSDSTTLPTTTTSTTSINSCSANSTPHSSPHANKKHGGGSSSGFSSLSSKVPALDLMSLAPEQKQVVSAVKRGWPPVEGGGKGGDKAKVVLVAEIPSESGLTLGLSGEGGSGSKEERSETALTVKELARIIHELKNSIREFEGKFMDQHKRKPSNHEKSPIRGKLIELSRLKKLFKEKKECLNEEKLSRTAPAEVKGSSGGSASRLLQMSEASTSDSLSPRSNEQRTTTVTTTTTTSTTLTTGPSNSNNKPTFAAVASSSSATAETQATPTAALSPLQHTLNKIMCSLGTKRKGRGRPEDLELMDKAQIQEEKHAIQKALLNFEKHHGRPQTHTDKEIMRPLYDRYRSVKRAACGSNSGSGGIIRERENSRTSICVVTPRASTDAGQSFGTTAGGSSTAADTLASVTFLASLTESVEVKDFSKSGGLLPIAEKVGATSHSEQRMSSSTGEEHVDGVRHAIGGRDKWGSGRKRRGSGRRISSKKHFTEEELLSASLVELREQNSLLLSQKADLRKILRDFENGFEALNGRSVTKQDRRPMEKEYNQYKSLKTKLKTIEILLAKVDPQRTI